jgi:hypothetical protein
MTALITLQCDKENRYGTCAQSALFRAATIEEARKVADQQGWYSRPGRNGAKTQDLCPGHSGRRQ